jgi:hypothetical protein
MYSRGLNPGQQGVGDEENQLPGIGTYRNKCGANRLRAEPGPAKPLALDDGQEPAIGEYKWIWFIVIILVISMFLCLFLYVFKIIK